MKICPLSEQSRSMNGKKWLVMLLAMTLFSFTGLAQSITGFVSDDSGEPLPGASVLVQGTTNGTITDVDGKFTLQGVASGAKLEVTYVGYQKQVVVAQNDMRIVMKDDSQLTEEVVVIGYGTVKKSDLTGAVASVRSDKIEKVPMGVTSLLQGKVAGVNITSTSGGNMQIRVRGTTSLNKSNEPLWVVDGVIGGTYNSMNEVESIEVLKDASSTAIYGARGANGVILVTTKKAKEGLHVMLDTRLNWSMLPKKPDLLSPYEYAQAYNYVNGATAISQDDLAAYKAGTKGVDWFDMLFHTAFSNSYNLNISGGSKKSQYAIVSNASGGNSIVPENKSRSYNIKSSLNSEWAPWVKFNGYIYVGMGKSRYPGSSPDLGDVYTFSPTMEVQDANGVYLRDPYNSIHSSPLGGLYSRWGESRSLSTSLYGNLTFKIIDGLTFSTSGLYSAGESNSRSFTSASADTESTAASAGVGNSHSHSWRNINNVTYDKYFGDHHLTATAVAEFTKSQGYSDSESITQIDVEQTSYWNTANGTPFVSSGFSNSAMASFLGRAQYAYKGKYLLTGTFRADASSVLSKNNRWAYFPSVGIGWNIHEEDFFNKDFVNQLKVRASYGQIGNAGIGSYSTLANLSFNSRGYTYGIANATQYTGYMLGTAPNTNLKWERTAQYNIGVDLGILNNRVTFTTDIYYKKTTDLLFAKSIASYDGGGSQWVNQGQVDNKGIEFTLNALPIVTKKLNWESTLTASFNRNKVVDLGGEDYVIPDAGRTSLYSDGVFILKKGESVGRFYLYNFAGFNDNGDNIYYNLDGTTTTNPNADQRIMVGKSVPDWIFGWSNTLTYKNWDMSAQIRFTSHYDRLNVGRYEAGAMAGPTRFITLAEAYYRSWDKVLDKSEARFPSLKSSAGMNTPNSTQWLAGGTFLRMQNLTVGYTFPKEWTKIANIRLGLTVQNLFVISGYKGLDPETVSESGNDTTFGLDDGSIPVPRSYNVALRFEF